MKANLELTCIITAMFDKTYSNFCIVSLEMERKATVRILEKTSEACNCFIPSGFTSTVRDVCSLKTPLVSAP